ncbi:superoxide dismutase [Candidatus Micrarchaeota archaeon]|nr:superoxide dismutase [Candidatus Micrarchaeota archaeon]
MTFEKHVAIDFSKVKPSVMKMNGISETTMTEHFKLYNGYVNKYNECMEKTDALGVDAVKAGQITYSDIRSLKMGLAFALGGTINHEVYFHNLGGVGGKPSGLLEKQIEKDFGSYERFEAEFRGTAMAARGWAFLVWQHDLKRLIVVIGDDQSTFPPHNSHLVLACDVYEHAYYLDHKTARAAYLDAYFKNVDWKDAESRFEHSIKH